LLCDSRSLPARPRRCFLPKQQTNSSCSPKPATTQTKQDKFKIHRKSFSAYTVDIVLMDERKVEF
jgi:hypothetical protein